MLLAGRRGRWDLPSVALPVFLLAVAASRILTCLVTLAFVAGSAPFWLLYGYHQATLLCVVGGLCALLYFLLHTWTGRKEIGPPLLVAYGCVWVGAIYYLRLARPVGYLLGDWGLYPQNATEVVGPLVTTLILLLVVPQILGTVAYLSVNRRTTEPSERYRINMTGGSLLLWFGSALLVAMMGAQAAGSDFWQAASRLIEFAAGVGILLAHRPPRAQGLHRRRDASAAPAPPKFEG